MSEGASMAVSRDVIEQKLAHVRLVRDAMAADVMRLEGAIGALEDLLVDEFNPPVVQTASGPAIDLTDLVDMDSLHRVDDPKGFAVPA